MKIKLDSTGITGASYTMILGIIVLQVIGVTMALPYTLPLIILGGLTVGAISYFAYRNPNNDSATFFRRLSIAIATMLGGFLGGATVGPFLLIFATLIPPNILLVLTILAGSTVLGLMAFILDKGVNWLVKRFKPSFQHSPWSLIVWSTSFIFMILGGSIGISLGLFGWGAGLLAGAIIGVVVGLLNHFLNPSPNVAKVLGNLFAISGLLVGVMAGIIINAFLPVPILYLGCILGMFSMLVAAGIGTSIGKNIVKQAFINQSQNSEAQQKYFDLDNQTLRQTLYIALSTPLLIIGYLAGGLYGFHMGANILLSQAFGTTIAGGVATCLVAGKMLINKICKKPEAAPQKFVVTPSSATQLLVTKNNGTFGVKATADPAVFSLVSYSPSQKTANRPRAAVVQ